MSPGWKRVRTLALPAVAAAGLAFALATISLNARDPRQTAPRIRPAGPDAAHMQGVSAIGLVQPESEEIDVGASLSGVAVRVNVVPGAMVRANDELFSLDTRAVAAELAMRRADLSVAESRLAQARSSTAAMRAQAAAADAAVEEARAALAEAQDLVKMAEGVKVGQTITVLEATRRGSQAAIAKARLDAALARRLQARAELSQYVTTDDKDGPVLEAAQAAVEQARAAIAQTQTSLALHTTRAPVDATVLQVNIHPGEFVQAGPLATPLLVLGQLNTLRVRAEVEEADLPRLDPRAAAWASPRGASDQRFHLRPLRVEPLVIAKTQLAGSAVERVDTRVLRIVYEIDAAGRTLYPGQQMDVYIPADGEKAPVAADELSRR